MADNRKHKIILIILLSNFGVSVNPLLDTQWNDTMWTNDPGKDKYIGALRINAFTYMKRNGDTQWTNETSEYQPIYCQSGVSVHVRTWNATEIQSERMKKCYLPLNVIEAGRFKMIFIHLEKILGNKKETSYIRRCAFLRFFYILSQTNSNLGDVSTPCRWTFYSKI